MQEWVEWLKAYEYELPLELQIKSKELLVLEKEQLIITYIDGCNSDCMSHESTIVYANDYYNKKFKQE